MTTPLTAPFEIYPLAVLSGQLALSPLPGRSGDYTRDLQIIRAWRPALVMSMTEASEMAAHGAANLGDDLGGARWRHFPIIDFGVPDDSPDVALEWSALASEALDILRGGGRVLIHCMGGCGRSGMAALRLMVLAGETPDDALTRLRVARPCAVETDAQRAWAAGMGGAAGAE